MTQRLGLVVLAGGTSLRWGGQDKTAADLAGRPVLVHVLDAGILGLAPCDPDPSVVVVAGPDHAARDAVHASWPQVVWTREEPAPGGPVAGLAAGLQALGTLGAPAGCDLVAVLAGDLPLAGPAVVRLLRTILQDGDADAAVGLDPLGRRQPLLGVYRTGVLDGALNRVTEGRRPAPTGHAVRGPSLREVLDLLRVREVPVSADEALDLDTPERLARAARILRDDPE